MSLTELLAELHALPRTEKLRAIQFLAGELAREDGAASLEAGQAYPVWSPFDANEAAGVLLQALQTEMKRS